MQTNYIPKQKQLEFLDWEFGTFFHFGIRTYYEGYHDWDEREMTLDAFCPDGLDCDQWLRVSKEAGAAYAVLVCKHHDGFANWPSAYTEYSVKNTPWKHGKGDVVREFTDACRKYQLKVGLYYSPAQAGSDQTDIKEYDDYFIHQLGELLTNYGKIDYLWFDGCGSHGHQYDTKRIIKEIRRMQPDILLFNLWEPDVRWVGNEAGIANMPNPNNVVFADLAEDCIDHDYFGNGYFLPAECDCSIRNQWFYSDRNESSIRSVEELMGLYYYSVGRGANLLLNIAPDRQGKLPDADIQVLQAFAKERQRRFTDSVVSAHWELLQGTAFPCYRVSLEPSHPVNHVVLAENLQTGDHIKHFRIFAYPEKNGKPYLVFEGYTVGHKRICQFPTMRVEQLDIVITESDGEESLKGIQLLYC